MIFFISIACIHSCCSDYFYLDWNVKWPWCSTYPFESVKTFDIDDIESMLMFYTDGCAQRLSVRCLVQLTCWTVKQRGERTLVIRIFVHRKRKKSWPGEEFVDHVCWIGIILIICCMFFDDSNRFLSAWICRMISWHEQIEKKQPRTNRSVSLTTIKRWLDMYDLYSSIVAFICFYSILQASLRKR